MATKAQCVAAGCPDDCCDALVAKGLDLGKVFAIVQLVVKYIPLVKADPAKLWDFVTEVVAVFFPQPAPAPVPPAPTPPTPMPAP